ncbi:MAG: alpha-amylase family glycosyl hydrolase, partial [Clostridia bacterium]|nr:alpha-amylase family glycosyl hydrolase [Clostridia bacterium]
MKRSRAIPFLLAGMVLLSSCGQSQQAQNKQTPTPTGPHPYAKTEKMVNPTDFAPIQIEGMQMTDIAFSPDGQTLFATMYSSKENTSQIYYSAYQGGSWTKPEKAPFSTRNYDAAPFVTKDGQHIYFTASNDDGSNTDLYVTDKTSSGWSDPKALGPQINTKLNESAPVIDKDGSLVFCREEVRQNDYPLANMMLSKYESNTFTEPVALGKNINNGVPTYSMCVSPNGDYAIFTSPREGSFDLYVTYFEKGDFSYPEKLNIRVNTNNMDEVSPIISPDGKYLFFTSRTSYQETMDFSKWNYTVRQVDLDAVGIKTPEQRKASLTTLPDPYQNQTFPEVDRNKTLSADKRDVYYEIFVRSFADSDGNGIGDLNGITQNLDYIQNLGVTAIWLMPINASPSYHGYDVTDYYKINPNYGTIDDFKKLVSEAKKRNIDIIMDLVINHTSNRNPWFIESSTLKDGPRRYFYKWIGEGQEGYNLGDTSSWGSQVWHRSGQS